MKVMTVKLSCYQEQCQSPHNTPRLERSPWSLGSARSWPPRWDVSSPWDNMSVAQVARAAAVHGDVPFLFPRPYLRHGDEGQLGHSAIRVTPPRLRVPAREDVAQCRAGQMHESWADV